MVSKNLTILKKHIMAVMEGKHTKLLAVPEGTISKACFINIAQFNKSVGTIKQLGSLHTKISRVICLHTIGSASI